MIKCCVKYFIEIFVLALVITPLMIAQVTDTVHIRAKWNMVSLPLKVQDAHYLTIFPGALSQPFEHSTGFPPETLKIGKSYWMLFASDTNYLITGEPVHSITKELWAGWNMIGTLSYPIPISNIQTDPSGIIISDFFEYNAAPGYEKVDTLIPGSGYWVKVNQAGNLILTSMGYPCPGTPMIEYEGKTYHTVQIGKQCWLKENLDVGKMISGNQNQTNDGTIEKYCYNDNSINCNVYGGLYQWDEAIQYINTNGAQGICASGWHIPTIMELDTLALMVLYSGSALEEIGQGFGNGAGTNSSGFSALLSGYRYHCCGFDDSLYSTFYWSSTNIVEVGAPYAMRLANGDISFDYLDVWDAGFSIRCIKN